MQLRSGQTNALNAHRHYFMKFDDIDEHINNHEIFDDPKGMALLNTLTNSKQS